MQAQGLRVNTEGQAGASRGIWEGRELGKRLLKLVAV